MNPAIRNAEETPGEAGREALARGAWAQARDHFEAELAAEETAAALEGLSWSFWWLGEEAATFEARERAFRAYRAGGDACGAARVAVWLANDSLDFRGEDAVAAGWLERARQLLAGEGPCPEQGWLLVFDSYYALHVRGDAASGIGAARAAAALGAELGVPDLEALGLALEGDGLVTRGELELGMRRLDAAAALASGERFELPISPPFIQCVLIAVCEKAGDFARVAQWCEAMRLLGEELNGRHVIGVCRSAYGNVLTTRGEWSAAEEELTGALAALEATRPGMAPAGLVRLAELRARQGRVEEARTLFERALPEPLALVGLATLTLEQGDALGAAETAERVIRRLGADARLDRLPALELLARARAGLGDLDAASAALAELETVVGSQRTPYLTGRARLLDGELALASGEAERARRALEDAVDLFVESSAPYEAALARLRLAAALSALGRGEAAGVEARAAHDAFAALGADADAARASELFGAGDRAAGGGAPGGEGDEALGAAADRAGKAELTPRECEILRLIARGMSDAEIAAQLVVSPHTVHRHVANVRTKLRLPSRAAAVAYAAREDLL
jgi:ATP/maltotriose-dependent transcriptional regulator MalT